ncbi:methionine--tRNA ligase [Pelagibacteraceae bacterium]|nr:methionine--tRNA ligase [Pelagibacteraceae bacterium]
MKNNNFYITTPIYYPSGEPHIGHAYSSIIADVLARFKTNDNFNVFFLTGTDEHGLKIQKAAEKEGLSPIDFCDRLSKVFQNLNVTLNLSNNDFIRTTEKRHHAAVNELWNRLVASGDIYLSKYKGWYSVSDEAYYNDNEIDSIEGKKIAINSGSEVDWVEEESFFFKLSSWETKLLEFYEANKNFILPVERRNEVVSFVKGGLQDLSISRTSFSWGIEVPKKKGHVIYVWLDALTNYLSALNFPNTNDELFKKYWPASLHVIGKDILRFHAVYWPAFLLAANIKPPKKIFSHGWILSEDKKMSKSKGNILNPVEIVKDYGVDQLRYYLMKEVSHGSDGSISLKSLENCINSDLANNYGNLCQRIFSFISNNCNNKVTRTEKLTKSDKKILDDTNNLTNNLRTMMDGQNLNSYIKSVINISFLTNKYINDEEPWKLKKTNIEKMNNILHISLEQIAKISLLLNPIIPSSTLKVLDALNIKKDQQKLNFLDGKDVLPNQVKINNLSILFNKIIK